MSGIHTGVSLRVIAASWWASAALVGPLSGAAFAQEAALATDVVPYQLEDVTVTEQLGAQVDPRLTFTDHTGSSVHLGDYFDGRPVLLTMNYYSCASLCSVQLNALLEGLKELDWTAGDEFRVVTVSIDAREGPELAASKRDSYLRSMGRGEDVDWSFLVGDEENIAALAKSIGFSYRYDSSTDQFAHPAVLTFLSGDGLVSRYLYGIQYPAKDIRFSLIETAEGRVGSPVDKLILSCFRYDSTAGRYTASIFGIARLGGLLTIVALAGFGLVMWRHESTTRRDGSLTS